MINPNICKRLLVEVGDPVISAFGSHVVSQQAVYKGRTLEIHARDAIKPGRRYLYLKYSIMLDQYYLSKRG